MTKRYTVATGWTTGSSDHRRWPRWRWLIRAHLHTEKQDYDCLRTRDDMETQLSYSRKKVYNF